MAFEDRLAGAAIDWTRFAPDTDGALDPLQPVEVRSAADEVLERLVTALALGLYRPGDRLPSERDLVERLGVSRMTIREALARLDALGYVTTKRGRYGGTFVTNDWTPTSPAVVRHVLGTSWRQFEELFDLSRQLIPLLARLAAERRTPDDLAQLKEAMTGYAESVEREEIRRADRDFHWVISRATHNSMLVAASHQLRAQLTLGVSAFPYSEAIHLQADREHQEMLAAITAHDGDTAAELALRHFVELAEQPIRALYERAVPDQ